MMRQNDGVAQLVANQLLSLVHLLFGDSQRAQLGLVELQFILPDGLVATFLDISQNRSYRVVQLCQVQAWTCHDVGPLFALWIFENLHYRIIFSIGVTRMP